MLSSEALPAFEALEQGVDQSLQALMEAQVGDAGAGCRQGSMFLSVFFLNRYIMVYGGLEVF